MVKNHIHSNWPEEGRRKAERGPEEGRRRARGGPEEGRRRTGGLVGGRPEEGRRSGRSFFIFLRPWPEEGRCVQPPMATLSRHLHGHGFSLLIVVIGRFSHTF